MVFGIFLIIAIPAVLMALYYLYSKKTMFVVIAVCLLIPGILVSNYTLDELKNSADSVCVNLGFDDGKRQNAHFPNLFWSNGEDSFTKIDCRKQQGSKLIIQNFEKLNNNWLEVVE